MSASGAKRRRRHRGGIIGVSAALFLARKGVSATLCEKGRIGGEQIEPELGLVPHDGARARGIAAQHREPAHLAHLNQEMGADIGFRAVRHRLSLRYAAGDRGERGVVRKRARLSDSARAV